MKTAVKLLLVLMVLALVSCASYQVTDWRQPAYLSYATMGNTLESIRVTAKEAEAKGWLTPEKINQTKVSYGTARQIYRSAGDVLILASDAESAVKQQELIKQFNNLMTQAGNIAIQIEQIIKEVRK